MCLSVSLFKPHLYLWVFGGRGWQKADKFVTSKGISVGPITYSGTERENDESKPLPECHVHKNWKNSFVFTGETLSWKHEIDNFMFLGF